MENNCFNNINYNDLNKYKYYKNNVLNLNEKVKIKNWGNELWICISIDNDKFEKANNWDFVDNDGKKWKKICRYSLSNLKKLKNGFFHNLINKSNK